MLSLLVALGTLSLVTWQRNKRFALRRNEDHRGLIQGLQETASTLQLSLDVDTNPPFDFLATFRRQAGLNFEVKVEMDGDELHLTVDGNLVTEVWTEHHPEALAGAIDDIRGLLDGQYRVVVYSRDNSPVGTELQAPAAGDWEVVGSWWEGNLRGIEGRHQLESKVLQNTSSR